MKNSDCKGFVYKDDCKDDSVTETSAKKCTEETPCRILDSSADSATIPGTGWTWYKCDCCDSGCDAK